MRLRGLAVEYALDYTPSCILLILRGSAVASAQVCGSALLGGRPKTSAALLAHQTLVSSHDRRSSTPRRRAYVGPVFACRSRRGVSAPSTFHTAAERSDAFGGRGFIVTSEKYENLRPGPKDRAIEAVGGVEHRRVDGPRKVVHTRKGVYAVRRITGGSDTISAACLSSCVIGEQAQCSLHRCAGPSSKFGDEHSGHRASE